MSRDIQIHNIVYQGTVLGPPLWNIYCADVAIGMKWHGLLEIVRADNLNCFKDFRLFIPNSELHAEMR